MVAFHDIEVEIYVKAKQQAGDSVAYTSSSSGLDDDDDDDRCPAVKGRDFELDDGIDLTSIFLRNMVSDEWPAPDPMGLATPSIVATHLGMIATQLRRSGRPCSGRTSNISNHF